MSTAKSTTRKRRAADPDLTKSADLDLDLDLDLASDIKGIMSVLQQIREKAHQDGLKKKEETISRQSFAKSPSKSSKECENCLKTETTKFQAVYEKFCKDQANHLQTLKGVISNFEKEKERLFTRYEQLRKRERTMISGHEKACSDKISKLEESLKKKKQDNKTFSVLRKTLGSFLDDDDLDEEGVPLDD